MNNTHSIYLCLNKTNGKIYIGYDSDWPKRKYRHLKDSFNPKSIGYNDLLHKAIRKYGKDSFEWSVIYQSKDGYHCLKEMESIFIKQYNSYIYFDNSNGYNMTLGGDGVLGLKKTEETKQKHSKKSSKTYNFWLNEKIITITNLKQYCKDNNIHYSCLMHLSMKSLNKFKYKNYYPYDNEKTFDEVLIKYNNKINNSMKIMGEKHSRKWKLESPNGTIHEFSNLSEFCRKRNLCHRKMRQTLMGKCKYYPGWKEI